MMAAAIQRTFIRSLDPARQTEVRVRGWIYRLRVLAKTTFIIVKDCSGEAQSVAASEAIKDLHLKLDDAVEIQGRLRVDSRSKSGYEIDTVQVKILGRAATNLPFNSVSDIASVGTEVLVEYRPLALRTEAVGPIF